ncbi:hypothetical protein [Dyella acidisoli]|uniref:hypothetical protein n=1 Tax=Dyella acidisoli TaxID=1867834 RepID=UPI0024E05D3B|nr:hypothetical protein [Dyella acidisoli]
MKIAAALISVLTLVLGQFVIARGLPFTPHGHLVRDIISLLIANAMIWLSRRSDWSMQTRAQLFGAGWIWLIVQLGCSIYLLHNGV